MQRNELYEKPQNTQINESDYMPGKGITVTLLILLVLSSIVIVVLSFLYGLYFSFGSLLILLLLKIALIVQIALKKNTTGIFVTLILEIIAQFIFCAIGAYLLVFGCIYELWVLVAIIIIWIPSMTLSIIYTIDLRKKYQLRMALVQPVFVQVV